MDTIVQLSPGQRLKLERMECVCRDCYKLPTQRHHRNYCARCGKPFAWPAGTTLLPRAEALKRARADERQKCVSELIALTNQIYQEYQGHSWVDKASAQDNDHSSASVQFALRRAIACIKD